MLDSRLLILIFATVLQLTRSNGFLLDESLIRPRPNTPLYCVVCSGEKTLLECNKRRVQLCSGTQECYMQVYRYNNVNHYYGGCGETNNCHHVQSPNQHSPLKFRHLGKLICGECCPDAVCHMSLCQDITHVGTCVSCEDASTMSECTVHQHCPGEKCYLQVFHDTVHGRNRIYAGCALSEECSAVQVQALTYNSSIAPVGRPACGECCVGRSNCNILLCQQAVAQVPTTPLSTTEISTTHHGAFCPVCDGETSLHNCTSRPMQLCASNEECYMQVFLENGIHHYYGGCGKTNNCAHVQAPTSTSPVQYQHTGRLVCGECCQDPVCYMSLCQQFSLVDFCAHCEDASSMSECTHFQQCPGEACYLQVFKDTVHLRNRIYAGCALPQECAAARVQALTTNTSIAPPGPPACGECCNDRSICNTDHCQQAVATVPGTQAATTATSASTISTTHKGDFCPVCDGETSLNDCNKRQMQLCNKTEECYIQVFIDNGVQRYYGGCGETNNCAHVQSPTSISPMEFRHNGRLICGECCQDPVCYMSLCRQISLVDFCAHCEDANSISECAQFQQCPGEACYIQVFKDTVHGRNRIYAGCVLPQECAAARVQALTTNTSIAPPGPPACGECCNDRSLCNSDHCQQAVAEIPSTQTSLTSTTSTTTTTTTTTTLMPTTEMSTPNAALCPVCNGEPSLQECGKHQRQQCINAEECYMQVFLENGTSHYYGGCAVTNNCAHVQSPTPISPAQFRHQGRQICGECCQDHVCYSTLCQQISLVDFCAHCEDASSMSECAQFHQCPGEVCYLQVFKDTVHGRNRIYAGCALPQECAVARVQALTRNVSIAPIEAPACGGCCNDRSLCNSGLCQQAAAEIPSTQSSLTPTASTTSVQTALCAVCDGETSLNDCGKNQKQKCNSTEECYMQVFQEHGVKYYYGGCAETNNCFHVQSPKADSPIQFRHQGRQICGECCHDPSCYTSLCKEISLVDFCKYCDSASSISECTSYKQCPGENCYLQVFKDDISGSNRVYAGCVLPQECVLARSQALSTNTSTAPSGTPICGNCCNDRSLCNSVLCQATSSAPPTSTSGITIPTPYTPTEGTTSAKPTSASGITPYTPPGVTCEVCQGGLCGHIPNIGKMTKCSDSEPFCLNQIDNDEHGSKVFTKRCASVSECETLWWHGSATDTTCTTFKPQDTYPMRLSCHFCCTAPNCNLDIIPQQNTLFSGLKALTAPLTTTTTTTTATITTNNAQTTIGHVRLCAACDDVISMKDCNHVQQCPGKECFVQVYEDLSQRKTSIFAGCTTNQSCTAIIQQSSSTTNTSFGVPVCGDCCYDRDFCNADLCPKPVVDAQTEMTPATATLITTVITTQPPTTKTLTTTSTTTALIKCEVCNGTLCGVIPGHDPVVTCPPEKPYCMNNVENDSSGKKTIIKRCTSLVECDRRWWHETSDSSSCISFNPNNVYMFRLSCYFCCTKSGCNKDIVPSHETLYIGSD